MARFDGIQHDSIKLARRIATLISYEIPKREIVDTLRGEGIDDDDIFFAYAAAKMMLKWEDL